MGRSIGFVATAPDGQCLSGAAVHGITRARSETANRGRRRPTPLRSPPNLGRSYCAASVLFAGRAFHTRVVSARPISAAGRMTAGHVHQACESFAAASLGST